MLTKAELRQCIAATKVDDPLTIRVVRHGATALNGVREVSVDKERGWSNVPLTEEGRQDAVKAGMELKGQHINAIVSSDLERAVETADIIGTILGIKPAYSFMLRPWDMGNLTTKLMSEVTPQIEMYARDKPDMAVPEGESFNEFRRRGFEGVARAIAKNRGQNVLIVAHHRIERLLAGWRAAGQPINHQIDIKTFIQRGDPPGGVIELKTHRQLLNGQLNRKFTHSQVDYGPGHSPEFCRTCEYSDHQPHPHCAYVEAIERGGWCTLWDKA